MLSVKGFAGAVAGGVLGALVWAAVSYFAEIEAGYVAIGVGVAAGVGGAIAAGSRRTPSLGVVSALVALVAVLVGKALSTDLMYHKALAGVRAGNIDDGRAIAGLQEKMFTEFTAEAKLSEEQVAQAKASPEMMEQVAAAARDRWNHMDPYERLAVKREVGQQAASQMVRAGGPMAVFAFVKSLGLYDALWIFLATGAAYRSATRSARVKAPAQPLLESVAPRPEKAQDERMPAHMAVAEARAERAGVTAPAALKPEPQRAAPTRTKPTEPSKAGGEPTSVAHPFLRAGGPGGGAAQDVRPLKMASPEKPADPSSRDAA